MSFVKPAQQPAQQRALASKYKKAKEVKTTHIRNTLIRLFAVLLPAILIVVLVVDLLGNDDLFAIEAVEYQGKFNFVDQAVVDELALSSLDGNFFTVNLAQIKERLESVDWVETVSLGKKWPGTLSVQVDEYEPKANWYSGGWISANGELITAGDPGVAWLNQLPIFKGDLSELSLIQKAFTNWESKLLSSGISVKQVALSDANSWELVLQSDSNERFNLLLGSVANIDQRFMRFISLYDSNPSHFEKVVYVDARYPNGVAVKHLKDIQALPGSGLESDQFKRGSDAKDG